MTWWKSKGKTVEKKLEHVVYLFGRTATWYLAHWTVDLELWSLARYLTLTVDLSTVKYQKQVLVNSHFWCDVDNDDAAAAAAAADDDDDD